VQSVPPMLFAVVVSAALGSGIWQTAVAVGLSGVANNVRLIRGQILTVRSQEYVEAALATGSSNARVMFKQILPNVLSPVIVSASMGIGGNITAISSLSFIGLGVQPPTSEWGNIMTDGLDYIRQFWPMAVFPGIMIMLTLFAFNCAGDGLRDAMDPKLKQ
ncbi:MAG: ABC transporter permease, partial [Oscillospiraceae bacterium]|nr:ABC transporter permease [Oscillospiraceae bacterium]